MTDAAVPYPGLPVQVGAATLVMPPLSAKGARQFLDRIAAVQRGEEADPLGLAAQVTHACLRRNYPDLSLDAVEDTIDFDNFEAFLMRAVGQGAFKKWCEAQALLAAEAGSGNPRPQPVAADGTGAPSTPASPPPPAGDTGTSTS